MVTRVAYQKYAGNYINIRYNKTYSARFLHNSRILVKKGQHVTRGQVIALSGATGEVTGPHVHYELHIDGKPVNPMTAKIPLATSVSPKEKQAFEERVAQYNKMMSTESGEPTSNIKLANK
ncbi:M23 family metallopeptidase [Photobacterium kishitanii]|uniref:M23 family metallopeptidase n=1 Tax=Photobacterium kishitanii TaxID=318456 RepID=UPI00273A39F9|nr:peptidoglycan DD-metalloendopeptidase family protein [Photobacterium kishitanii]